MERVEAVIIGSGFGGAVTALRLCQRSIQTVMLERGKRWPVSAKGDTFCTYARPDGRAAWLSTETVVYEPRPILRYAGVLERRKERGIEILAGAGVGGGSLVYNSVLLQPTRDAFRRVFPPAVDYDEFDRDFYPRVRSRLSAAQLPGSLLKLDSYLATRLFLEIGEKAGLSPFLLDVATDWQTVVEETTGKRPPSASVGECWYGMNSGAKNSLDKNYLREAERLGLEIRALTVVESIEGSGSRFKINYRRITESGETIDRDSLECRALFLAAGSMGTSALLVRAKALKQLPRLNEFVGKYWSTNGDTFSKRKLNENAHARFGGPATAGIHFEQGNNGPHNIILCPDWEADDTEINTMGMCIPTVFGHFEYDSETDSVVLVWPREHEGNKRLLESAAVTYALFDRAAGSTAKGEIRDHMTAHPLGGAVIGKACDLFGRLSGYEHLYVMDGALMPGSTAACNPSLTISAFAERNMDEILKRDF